MPEKRKENLLRKVEDIDLLIIEREVKQMEFFSNDRPVVYICSPFSRDKVAGCENAKRYSRHAVDAGAIPFAPHLLLPMYMKEDSERGQALYMDMVFLRRCDELWVFGHDITSGMQAEIDQAMKLGMKIRYFTENYKEEARHAI